MTIESTVIDSASGSPVPFANVIVKGTLEGTSTDGNGSFKLLTKQVQPVIVISSLGYFTLEIKASDITGKKILLRSKSIALDEVVVSGDRVKTFQEGNSFYYMDFDFYDDHILALAASGSKKYLHLLNTEGDLIARIKVNGKSQSIYRDCIGNLHLLTPDSSYQVYYDYMKLRLLSSYSIDKFDALLRPCICMHKNVYYFRHYEYRGLKCNYFCVKENEPGKLYPFRLLADSARIENFNAQYDLGYFLKIRRESRGEMYGEPVSTLKKNLDKHREALVVSSEEAQWIQPVEAELHAIGDAVYLFSFTDSVMEKYHDHDSLSATMHLNFPGNKRNLRTVIVDKALAQAYVPSEKSGIITLHRIDLSSGREEAAFTLNGFVFPAKLKIRNRSAYFLYRDKSTDKPARITRMSLQ